MKFNWSQFFASQGRRQTALLALSSGLALGFAGGQLLHSDAHTSAAMNSSAGAPVRVHSGPSRMFHSWWQSMDDPDAMFRNFDVISSDLDRTFAFPLAMGTYIPRLDAKEKGNDIKITAEVPGVDEKDLDVTVTDDSITIKGEKKDGAEQSKSDKSSLERSYGSFERTLSLPCKVQSDKAEAVLKNGILTVTVPKSQVAESEGRKISIRRE